MTTTINSIDDIKAAVGTELGTSDWYEVTQARIDAFADATEDWNFIHVDPVKAADSPFGSTIAHGLFSLSLGPKFLYEVLTFGESVVGVNYGYGKVRFPAPVPVNSRIRMTATLTAADEVPGGLQLTITQHFEIEGGEKPVCVAESLSRLFTGS